MSKYTENNHRARAFSCMMNMKGDHLMKYTTVSSNALANDAVVPLTLLSKQYDTVPPAWHSRTAIVPLSLVLKKYDTTPPAWRPRCTRTISAESSKDESSPNSNNNAGIVAGQKRGRESSGSPPATKRRQVASIGAEPLEAAGTTSSQGSTVERTMITLSKKVSKSLNCLAGFPGANEPFPQDFTLTELCTKYPNHLVGENLRPFIQHGWLPPDIMKLLPQAGLAAEDRITDNAIWHRLNRAKNDLKKGGMYNQFMAAPKTHAER